jgi:tRNA pseudouridine13 synthase
VGPGELRSAGRARELEEAAVAPFADLRAGPRGARPEAGAPRAARARAGAFVEWRDDALVLRFRLGPGAYATEVLAELGEVG